MPTTGGRRALARVARVESYRIDQRLWVDDAGEQTCEMLDVVGELVRRVTQATVLEVDQSAGLAVPEDVGRLAVGDPDG